MQVDEVRGERRVVVGVIPVPRAAPLVVVPAHPVQAPDVFGDHAPDDAVGGFVVGAHLCLIVPALPAGFAEPDRIVLHLVQLVALLLHDRLELLVERIRVDVLQLDVVLLLGRRRLRQLLPVLSLVLLLGAIGDVLGAGILGALGAVAVLCLRLRIRRRSLLRRGVFPEELRAEQLGGALVRRARRRHRGLGRRGRRRRRRGRATSHGGKGLPGHRARLDVTVGGVDGPCEPFPGLVLVLVHARVAPGALPAEELTAHLVLPARLSFLLLLLPLPHALLGPRALLEDGLLVRPDDLHELLDSSQIRLAVAAQVPAQGRQLLPVHRHDQVDRALPDLQRGRVRQEIVTHEEAHKHKVVEHALLVVSERQISPVSTRGCRVQVHGEVLAQHRDGQELIGLPCDGWLGLGDLAQKPVAIGREIGLWRVLLKDDFPQDPKVWLVRREREHDEIRVEAVHHVLGVRVEPFETPLLPDVVHGLVLAFSRDGRVGHDHLDASPRGIRVHPLMHVVLKRGAEPAHERGTRRDDVAVDDVGLLPRRDVDPFPSQFRAEFLVFFLLLLGLLRGSESTRALLVHLRPRRDAVDGHVQQLAGADHGEEPVDVVEDALEHFFLGGWRRAVLGVEARVDDAVHVEVEVIELGAVGVGPGAVHRDDVAVMVPRLVLDDILDDQRVLLAEPAVEGGNSHVDNLGEIVPAAAESAEPLILLTPHEAGRRGRVGSIARATFLPQCDRVDPAISFDAPRACTRALRTVRRRVIGACIIFSEARDIFFGDRSSQQSTTRPFTQ